MRKFKSTWFWAELYRLTPETVERCACVAQLTTARRLVENNFQETYDKAVLAGDGEIDCEHLSPDVMMAQLDEKHKVPRRWLWASLVLVGFALTVQPWYSVSWFSLVMLVAGAMLCALEFSPRKGQGFIDLVRRIRSARKPESGH